MPKSRIIASEARVSMRAPHILFALSVLLAGCSSGSSGGGGGGGTGGGSGPFFTGPVVDCQQGDIDLSTLPAPGVSVFPVDGVTLDNPVTIAGSSGFESNPIALCVPNDAVSLVVYGDPVVEVLESSYVASGLGEIVDTSSVNTLIRVETPDLMLPKGPEVLLVPGRHVMKLASQTQVAPNTQVAVRRGARSDQSQLALNVILVGDSGIDTSNAQAFGDASARLENIYASAGVTITGVGAGNIADTSLSVIADTDLAKLATATVTPSANAPLIPSGVNLYFVREILSNDAAGTLLGHAMGIPGTPAISQKAGVVLSVDAHRISGNLDFDAMWVTTSHEMGHWHGLRHTTERFGTIFDLIRDTPECPANRDFDHNGFVDSHECAGLGGENLMFWFYDLTKPPTQVSAGQAFLLSSALYITPM